MIVYKDAVIHHPKVQELFAQITDELGEEGRILLRKSGTESVVRVMVEAQ